jgi:membrane-associated phospholipid phosphatase
MKGRRAAPWRRAEWLFLLSAALSALFLAVAAAQGRAAAAVRLDRWAELSIRGALAPPAPWPVRAVSFLGAWEFLAPASILVVAVLWRRGLTRRAWAFAASVAGAGLLAQAFKYLVRRPRPEILEPLAAAGGFSFPSGHSALSAAFFGALAGILASSSASGGRAAAWLAAGVGTVLLVGASRVALGVHWATDVAAGWLLGFGWIFLVFRMFERRAAESFRDEAG